MTIIDKIKKSVHDATGLPVYYDSEELLNVSLDNGKMPCAYFALLQDGSLIISNGLFRERVNIAIFFVDLTEFQPDAEENEKIIHACKLKAYQWLGAMQLDKYFTLESVTASQRVYQEMDVTLTGYAVRVALVEKQGECYG